MRVRALRVLEASAKIVGVERVRRRLRPDAPHHALRQPARRRAGDRGAARRDARGARARVGHHASGDLWRMTAASALGRRSCWRRSPALLRLPDAIAHRDAGAFAMLPALFMCAAVTQMVAGIAAGVAMRERTGQVEQREGHGSEREHRVESRDGCHAPEIAVGVVAELVREHGARLGQLLFALRLLTEQRVEEHDAPRRAVARRHRGSRSTTWRSSGPCPNAHAAARAR